MLDRWLAASWKIADLLEVSNCLHYSFIMHNERYQVFTKVTLQMSRASQPSSSFVLPMYEQMILIYQAHPAIPTCRSKFNVPHRLEEKNCWTYKALAVTNQYYILGTSTSKNQTLDLFQAHWLMFPISSTSISMSWWFRDNSTEDWKPADIVQAQKKLQSRGPSPLFLHVAQTYYFAKSITIRDPVNSQSRMVSTPISPDSRCVAAKICDWVTRDTCQANHRFWQATHLSLVKSELYHPALSSWQGLGW